MFKSGVKSLKLPDFQNKLKKSRYYLFLKSIFNFSFLPKLKICTDYFYFFVLYFFEFGNGSESYASDDPLLLASASVKLYSTWLESGKSAVC